jgi:hypothetical protein
MKYNPKRHNYGAEVEAHFFWQDRDQLAFWMKNFLTQEIDDESF